MNRRPFVVAGAILAVCVGGLCLGVDLRRGNLDLHLMYKALFELSADRAEFVSRLFSRPRPSGLESKSVSDILAAFDEVPASEALYNQNLQAIREHLMTKRGFALSP